MRYNFQKLIILMWINLTDNAWVIHYGITTRFFMNNSVVKFCFCYSEDLASDRAFFFFQVNGA